MIIKSFSPEWKLWIWTNVVNGFDKESIFNILLNHGFDYALIKRELEIEPVKAMIWQRQYSQSELMKSVEISLLPLNKNLCDNPNVYRVETNLLEMYRVPDFLTYAECDSVIEMNNEYLDIIEKRIDSLTRISPKDNDVIEIQKHPKEGDMVSVTPGDWTVVVFLNNIIEGGEIDFPKLEMKIKSVKGEAVIWNNRYHDGELNQNSEYYHLPSNEDEKITIIKTYSTKEKEVQEITLDDYDDFVEVK
jgi:prolyl 4-hydroxylase